MTLNEFKNTQLSKDLLIGLTLLAALLFTGLAVSAQTNLPKKDTVAKVAPPAPGFQPNFSQTFSFTVTLPMGATTDYIFTVNNPYYASSAQLNGQQIQGIQANSAGVVKAIQDSILSGYNAKIRAQRALFTADSLRKVKAVKK